MAVAVVDLNGPKGRIIDAALALATERPWSEVSLRDIAERAGMGLVDLRNHFSAKGEVLAAFVRAVDDAMLTVLPDVDADNLKRDQLFEIVMARFDTLMPYKAALKSISADASADLALIKALAASQAWMLEAAGIGSGGLDGGVRVAGLATVYGSVYRTWLHDDDPGQARTMAVMGWRARRGTLVSVWRQFLGERCHRDLRAGARKRLRAKRLLLTAMARGTRSARIRSCPRFIATRTRSCRLFRARTSR